MSLRRSCSIFSVQQQQPPGCCLGVFGVAAGTSARSSSTQRSLPRSPPQGQASSDVAGTSGSAPPGAARTGSEEEATPEQDQAALTWSGYVAMMRSALTNIQEDAEGQEQAPFAKVEEAMTGLMQLTYGKAEPPNPPELPREFATRWLHDDDDLSQIGVMDDPVILASGYSVDLSYYQCFYPLNKVCPVTNKTLSHSSTAPNHLLEDMIAAWRLDHMTHSPASTADKLAFPMVPSDEQIQDILQKFSDHPVMQEEALHEIHLLSKITKGEQPCLQKWPELLQQLIDLQTNWKSTWKQNLEEERLGVILNLSVHRPNREILARENRLPVALKNIVAKLQKQGSPASALAKVASIVAIMSEFDKFRKGILDIGAMEMLRDLLKIEDAAVRKEAVTAIRGLCADEEGKANAQSYNVSDVLLECLTVSDEVLLLLDCLPKDQSVVDKMSEKAVELVNIIMAEHRTGLVTREVTYSAISLVHTIVKRNWHMAEKLKNLVNFRERLAELLSKGVPTLTVLQIKEIIQTLEKIRGYILREKEGLAYTRPNEFAVRWSMKNDEISYPLYAETLGTADPSVKSRKEWTDIRVVRKLRPLRDTEKAAARRRYEIIHSSYQRRRHTPNPIYGIFEIDHKNEERLDELKIPDYLLCSLCGELMVDPVAIPTGETFDRECLRGWFNRHGHICPVTDEPVSATILRNERVCGYLVEWRAVAIKAATSKTT